MQLWSSTKQYEIKSFASDYWLAYQMIIPAEKHIQSKAETFTVEGYNSLFRHFLARMRRKSKCYSKSMKMLQLSILLLMSLRNGILNIID
jgi:insertion element IS1 protein InsB